LVIKALDPYWIRIRIRIGIQRQTLDPDPDPEKMNTDPQHCKEHIYFWYFPCTSVVDLNPLESASFGRFLSRIQGLPIRFREPDPYPF
jgi:hypothetical protein